MVVLLADPDGSVGRARVSNPAGSVDLAAEGDAALVTTARGAEAARLTKGEINARFADALSALPPPPQRFTLFFEFATDEFTAQSRALVPEILKSVRAHAVPDVIVIGHTDTMGTQKANFELGMKRAMMVRALLVRAGLASSAIQVTSHGELDLLVKTADETREPRNRRVDVAVR